MSRENHIYEPDWSGRTDQLCSVNKPVIKKDALALVTGKPVYVDDLAPLRSVINYCRDKKRENPDAYGSLHIIYGSRSKDDLVDYQEILDEWSQDCKVDLTIDREQEGWDGHVGFIPNYVKELKPDLNRTVLICGPPIMIKFTLDGLKELGFQEEQVYTTMELRMKCGIGKCGRCNIGDKYVCKDGPVFRFDELSELPNEY